MSHPAYAGNKKNANIKLLHAIHNNEHNTNIQGVTRHWLIQLQIQRNANKIKILHSKQIYLNNDVCYKCLYVLPILYNRDDGSQLCLDDFIALTSWYIVVQTLQGGTHFPAIYINH